MRFEKEAWEPLSIDMTPLVDCIFAIILFLLVTSSFIDAMEQDLSIELPTQGQAVKAKAPPARPLVVNVRYLPGGKAYYHVENEPQTLPSLTVQLSRAKVRNRDQEVIIRGDRMVVQQDADGFKTGVAYGNLASFRQKREGYDEYVDGFAERIEYDGRKDRVTLTGRAELRRLRGTTLSDAIQGQVIVYDNLNDQFSVDGQARTQGSGSSGAAARVRAVLAPKPKEGTGR